MNTKFQTPVPAAPSAPAPAKPAREGMLPVALMLILLLLGAITIFYGRMQDNSTISTVGSVLVLIGFITGAVTAILGRKK